MKRTLLLLCTVISMPAFVPPPKGRALPTFGQMIQEAEEKQEGRNQQQRNMPQLLEKLPAELRREILRIMSQSEVLNIPALAQGITNLAATSKALHAAINNPSNMLTILKLLPRAGAVVLANGLRNMPGMKSDEVQGWLKSFKLEGGQELFAAASAGHPDMARVNALLANQNIAVNMKDDYGYTALMEASQRGHTEIARALLAAGANVNMQNKYGDTALMEASQRGHTEVVRALLAAGANVNLQNKGGNTALIWASDRGHTVVVRTLLAAGANVNMQDKGGYTALIQASSNGYTEVVRSLLAAGANVNLKSNNGNTALMWASKYGHTEVVRALLAAGANVNLQNKGGNTALICASDRGHTVVVRTLLAAGANVNMQDKGGYTALIWASEYGHIEVVRALLAAGANVNMEDNYGYTALKLARDGARYYPNRAAEFNVIIKLLEDAEKAQKEKAARK